ncbi:MAG: low-specificity L-threonine aldolase [Candidatus Nitrohelix vancouverensis]|uniref:Low-specificity L-threonine aldolase n=1 Tax=Candidatus Nitrohelix vancouverensis TaxID=2705534 RepID=A0A7T0C2P6_9BACT|nr:MAG: low-specificity L-threonine aldolase [Candidatus Nitrohelix vancouverensis]
MVTIDLRSDTLTQPTQEMRDAMATAEVGDDVFAEDPSINQLEQLAAQKLGKAKGLFVPSGTMGNLICLLTHCARGDEIIVGDQSHIFLNEVGGASALGGIIMRTAPNLKDGRIHLNDLEKAIRSSDMHFPVTRLIALENTHNYCQGSPLTTDYTREATQLAHDHGLATHLDGARLFNAAEALSEKAEKLAEGFDSVMFCFSKGLSAPVGSMICASEAFIQRARKVRKMLGGGMRQAGHLAAAGRIALETMTDRLSEDRMNAQYFAQSLATIEGIRIDPEEIKTNIVFFDMTRKSVSAQDFLAKTSAQGLKILNLRGPAFRAVFHREITREHSEQAVEIIKSALAT